MKYDEDCTLVQVLKLRTNFRYTADYIKTCREETLNSALADGMRVDNNMINVLIGGGHGSEVYFVKHIGRDWTKLSLNSHLARRLQKYMGGSHNLSTRNRFCTIYDRDCKLYLFNTVKGHITNEERTIKSIFPELFV